MTREEDIAYEEGPYWVLDLGKKGYEVYKNDVTHSKRVARIGFDGSVGLIKAKVEIRRRLRAES